MVTPRLVRMRGQASMEFAAAMIGALILLVAAVRIVFWATERYFRRVYDYDAQRAAAASTSMNSNASQTAVDSYEPKTKLVIYK
jgi:hypothetical protein